MSEEWFIEQDNVQIKEIEYIKNRLESVKKWGLEVEVITWALSAMKNDPSLSPADAFEQGCAEWDV